MSKVIVGGRAMCYVNGQLIGIFDSATVTESLGTEDIHILGAYGPQEIAITSYNSVTVNCTGFRVAGAGAKTLKGGSFPLVGELLTFQPFTITIVDREATAPATSTTPPVYNPGQAANTNNNPLATIINCVPENNNENFNSRATSKVNISYKGTMLTDESNPVDGEGSGAATLP
jgi:hypothetical protein